MAHNSVTNSKRKSLLKVTHCQGWVMVKGAIIDDIAAESIKVTLKFQCSVSKTETNVTVLRSRSSICLLAYHVSSNGWLTISNDKQNTLRVFQVVVSRNTRLTPRHTIKSA
eukprot:164602_1